MKDGALPTFKLTSGSLYVRDMGAFLRPRHMMRCMGYPVTVADCQRARADSGDLDALQLTDAELTKLAGNGMHVGCVMAVCLIAVLHVRSAAGCHDGP